MLARTQGPGTDRTIASVATVTTHVVLATWLLWSRDAGPAAQGREEALQVVWIERPRPLVPPALPPDPSLPAEATQPRIARVATETTPARTSATPAAPLPAEPAPARPLSTVFIEQGRALAEARHGHDFRRNPLVDPQAMRIEAAPERIRMQDPLTPAKVVARIGLLFGGPGYETDPCPRIRRNLGNLVTAGRDDEGLQEELHRHRQFCQQ